MHAFLFVRKHYMLTCCETWHLYS